MTPITWPCRFRSTPPEFPWLIAASVWIAFEIGKLSGALICRLSALTIPDVTLSARPNGLPIATTPSPTCTELELPSESGWSSDAGASTFTTARSVDVSFPTSFAEYVLPSQNVTWIDVAPETTCSFVTMSPFESYTKPEPWAWEDPPPPPKGNVPDWLCSSTVT